MARRGVAAAVETRGLSAGMGQRPASQLADTIVRVRSDSQIAGLERLVLAEGEREMPRHLYRPEPESLAILRESGDQRREHRSSVTLGADAFRKRLGYGARAVSL